MSGSTASTVGGGGGVSSPRIRSVIQWPRSTGEVVVPLAVTLRTLACVITPPRRLSAGSFTLRNRDAGDAGDAVMVGQPLVQEGEVRIDDVPRRQVGAQELGEEEPRLLQRGQLQRVVELVIVVERGGRRRVVDLPQVEPVIGERLDEAARLGVVEHPLGLGAQHVRLAQLAAVGQRPQRVVGDRVPQEQGQPRGEGVVVEPARLLLDEHEARRRQDGRVGREHRPA